jgi:hypothetical protein
MTRKDAELFLAVLTEWHLNQFIWSIIVHPETWKVLKTFLESQPIRSGIEGNWDETICLKGPLNVKIYIGSKDMQDGLPTPWHVWWKEIPTWIDKTVSNPEVHRNGMHSLKNLRLLID